MMHSSSVGSLGHLQSGMMHGATASAASAASMRSARNASLSIRGPGGAAPQGLQYTGGSGYEKVETYAFVGDGRGGYEKVVTTTHSGWRPRKCAWVALLTLVAPAVLYGGTYFWAGPLARKQRIQQPGASSKQQLIVTPTAAATAMTTVATTTSEPYDCSAGFSNWMAGWSKSKKVWCCTQYGRGCLEPSTTSVPYDCQVGFDNWQQIWAFDKRAWCCTHEYVGCATTVPPSSTSTTSTTSTASTTTSTTVTLPSTTPPPFDCSEGDPWAGNWASPKKVWCCIHHHRGCPTQPPPRKQVVPSSPSDDKQLELGAKDAAKACSTICKHEGHLASCRDRVQWYASDKFAGTAKPQTCQSAYMVVVQECPVCLKCPLAHTGCNNDGGPLATSAAFDCDAGYLNWEKGWSTAKKSWCCTRMSRACDPFDCDFGYAEFQTTWSATKRTWCCKDAGRGCTTSSTTTTTAPYDCQHGYLKSTSWPPGKAAWCCKHAERGCPATTTTLPYDCISDLDGWKKVWSVDQQAWCCQYNGQGCPKVKAKEEEEDKEDDNEKRK